MILRGLMYGLKPVPFRKPEVFKLPRHGLSAIALLGTPGFVGGVAELF